MEDTATAIEPTTLPAALPAIRLDDLKVEILKVDPLNLGPTIEVKIETQDQYLAAVDLHKRLGIRRKEWKEEMDPIVAARRLPWQEATDHRGTADKPLEALEKAVGRGMADWNRRQQEEADRLEKERQATLKVEQDRLQKEQEAERQRLLKADEDTRLATASKLEAEGKPELAQAVLSAPPPPPPIAALPLRQEFASLPRFAASVPGLTYQDNWKVRIPVDPALARAALLVLVQAAAKDPERYLHLLTLDEKVSNNQANRTSGQVPIPGFELFNDQFPVRRRK
jgi:hypothetical protein